MPGGLNSLYRKESTSSAGDISLTSFDTCCLRRDTNAILAHRPGNVKFFFVKPQFCLE